MSLTDFQSRTLAPALGGLAVGRNLLGPNQPSISGNALIGMDVWAGTTAAGRTLSQPAPFSGGGLDQVVNYILAPLG